MITYVYDGTIDGIFTCVFNYFVNKRGDEATLTAVASQLSFCGETEQVKTDYENNKRIIAALYRYGGVNLLNDLRYAFRSGENGKGTVIFNYIKATFEARANVSDKFSDARVLDFYDLIKRISYEVHRFKGFLRFTESVEGILYARFEPDNDIADLLLPHFSARLDAIPFAVHDSRRNVVCMHNGSENRTVKTDKIAFVNVSEKESAFGSLWKEYYRSVNIKERKNESLMRAFMPVRYHKNLPERDFKAAR